jgi:predicted NBD/HSP70 family sugar kinase
LLAGKLVTEAGPANRASAGRPPVGLVLSKRGPAGLGLDVKGDHLAACVVDLTGTVRHLAFQPGDQTGRPADDVLADLARLGRGAIAAVAADDLTVAGATLAVPGLIGAGGIVKLAPYVGWRDVPARDRLREAMDLPVSVDNEANLAALGELYTADDRDASFVYVSGESGLGAGIVLGGRLMRGARGWSGQLGHVSVDPRGRMCRCGSRGCVEAYASLDAILRAEPVTTSAAASATEISALADAGAPKTLAALHKAATALGIALSGLVNVLDIDTILLGSSYAVLASWLIEDVQAEINQRVLTTAWSTVDVRPAILGPDAAVIGAALTVIEEVRRNPPRWLAAA